MTPELIAKYDRKVPRYTSYPTAPHFTGAIGPSRYRRWLEGLEGGQALSIYIHIPFCASMCWFCGCHTKVVRRYEPIAAYLDALVAEIDLLADRLPRRHRIAHLHWGGGSPTMVSGADWRRVVGRLARRFDFANDAEFAVEIDPRTASLASVEALAALGVNRASLGVQDFDPDVQAAINRTQSFEQTARVVDWLRDHGITDLNIDLMYGLPRQTVAGVVEAADKAANLAPARVSVFGYAHVPWMKSHQRMIAESELPGAVERWQQFAAASARLRERGYCAIGLDHFARPDDTLARAAANGRLRRNFQGYTTDAAPTLLGLGTSAIGNLPQGYVQNETSTCAYIAALGGGELAVARGYLLDAEDRLRRAVIERLMCAFAVDVPAQCRHHGFDGDSLAAELASLAPLEEDGIVAVVDGCVSVRLEGRAFVRVAAAAFDAYLGGTASRHARAV